MTSSTRLVSSMKSHSRLTRLAQRGIIRRLSSLRHGLLLISPGDSSVGPFDVTANSSKRHWDQDVELRMVSFNAVLGIRSWWLRHSPQTRRS